MFEPFEFRVINRICGLSLLISKKLLLLQSHQNQTVLVAMGEKLMISIMIISTRARFNLLRDTAVDNRAPKRARSFMSDHANHPLEFSCHVCSFNQITASSRASSDQ